MGSGRGLQQSHKPQSELSPSGHDLLFMSMTGTPAGLHRQGSTSKGVHRRCPREDRIWFNCRSRQKRPSIRLESSPSGRQWRDSNHWRAALYHPIHLSIPYQPAERPPRTGREEHSLQGHCRNQATDGCRSDFAGSHQEHGHYRQVVQRSRQGALSFDRRRVRS